MSARRRAMRSPTALLGLFAVALVLAGLTGCAPSRAKGRLGQSSAEHVVERSDGELTVAVLPYTSEMERSVFGIDLHAQSQMAVELRIVKASPDGPTVVLRRQDVQLIFADGTARYPIDPLKVYELNRINTTGVAVAFGLVGALAASNEDADRHALFSSAGLEDVRLSEAGQSATGFLFFDLDGIATPQYRALTIEYEHLPSSDVRKLDIAL